MILSGYPRFIRDFFARLESDNFKAVPNTPVFTYHHGTTPTSTIDYIFVDEHVSVESLELHSCPKVSHKALSVKSGVRLPDGSEWMFCC
jgi:endonuclease/exonuclease/phosphatase family metal-dependent hydrolase